MDSGLREHEELVKQYFGTIIPQNDNKFAALNSAVWSGGSFIYVPPGVKVEMPLQAYFRINAENMADPVRDLVAVGVDAGDARVVGREQSERSLGSLLVGEVAERLPEAERLPALLASGNRLLVGLEGEADLRRLRR